MALSIQIFGRKKCKATKKAEMYFKERSIPFHLVDLDIKPLSDGELTNIANSLGGFEKLINQEAPFYQKKLKYLTFDAKEEITEHQELLLTPIIRINKKAFAGFNPTEWQELIIK